MSSLYLENIGLPVTCRPDFPIASDVWFELSELKLVPKFSKMGLQFGKQKVLKALSSLSYLYI